KAQSEIEQKISASKTLFKLQNPPTYQTTNTDITPIDASKQRRITHHLVTFIICDVQLLCILKYLSFRELIYECVSDYSILYDKTVKNIICGAYNWTHTQIIELIKNTAQTINLTTDL
ncbi:7265_t:CDS:2, partial [Cetraspora pellucida]